MENSLYHSPSNFRFWHMSVMMTETISLEYQVTNLTKLVEGLPTSLKEKDHKILFLKQLNPSTFYYVSVLQVQDFHPLTLSKL